MTQRETYKFIEKLLAAPFADGMEMLRALVHFLVEHKDFAVTGGRIWEIHPDDSAYQLKFQYGDIEPIPDGYTVDVASQPTFRELSQKRAVMNRETDSLLREKGIALFAAAGVGERVKRDGETLYHYVLAFNTRSPDQRFFDILAAAGGAASAALRDFSQRVDRKKLMRDLDQARHIQQSLPPEHTIRFQDYNVFGVSIPDNVVGGDYFDYLLPNQTDPDRLDIVISDAASKGLPAAIQALFVSGAIRMGVGFETKISALIARLNALLYETFPDERFVSLFYCEITRSANGLILYANAGHCPPLHYSATTGECARLGATGSILGVLPEQKFRVENINMMPGDILALYTDGVLEAQNANGELFGEERIAALIAKHPEYDAKALATQILAAVQDFQQGASYTDDTTLVIIKRDLDG
jgi:sigma-B regulation protein RsbU (phosphoserine phosphatase)